MNNYDVLKEMGERRLDIRLAPLSNITNLNYRKKVNGTDVTIGVQGNVVADLGLTHKFVGGLILADKQEFDSVKSELLKLPTMRTRAEIEAEIQRLKSVAKDYDTERQSNDTCLAAGAHDALRWALGLAEDSIADSLSEHHPSCRIREGGEPKE